MQVRFFILYAHYEKRILWRIGGRYERNLNIWLLILLEINVNRVYENTWVMLETSNTMAGIGTDRGSKFLIIKSIIDSRRWTYIE